MKIIDELEAFFKLQSRKLSADDFILRGMWKIDMAFKPTTSDSAYTDIGILAHTTGSGFCACFNENPQIDLDLLGKDVREITSRDLSSRIAILDAGFSRLHRPPTYSMYLQGSIQDKVIARANLITSEMMRFSSHTNSSSKKFLVVGAVSNIIKELIKTGAEVFATDLDKTLVNSSLEGVEIEDGLERTIPLLQEVDVALVTGMTLSTDTLDEILTVARKSKVKIVMFAQTGANIAPYYLDFGAKTVLSESFPSCIFPGDTLVKVYRNE